MRASEYLVEIGAHDDVGVRTERVSTSGYNTGPADNPANTHYAARVADPGYFQRHLFGPGRTMGYSEVSFGEVQVINPDGALDAWLDYGFDGRAVTIKRLTSDSAAYNTAVTVLRATVERCDSADAWMGFRLRLYDRRLELDRPLQTNRFAGTTSAPGPTAEGTADIKDQPKPMCFGRCFNVPGLAVNPYDLIYQVNDGAVAAIAVFDGGVQLTPAGDFATIAALQSAVVKPGRFATCLALGLFRLGATPAFKITADVDEGATAAMRRAGAVVTRMLARMGQTGSAIVPASFAALDAAAPYQVGLYIADDTTGREAMSRVLASVGGWIIPNADGAFEAGQMRAPGTAVGTITESDILSQSIGLTSNPDTDGGIPAWRVVLRYQPAFEVQDDAALGRCTDMARRGAVAQPIREVRVENAGIRTKHLLAPELAIDTVLVAAADAEAEAARRLALYGVRRDVLTFPVPHIEAAAFALGATAKVMLGRFGYGAGRDMVVIGRNEDLRNERVELTVWG